jgi:nucleoid-associated protein YgaU
VTKVILVLSVVALAVGVIWFATCKWGGNKPQEATAAAPAKAAPAEGQAPPQYNDLISTYDRWHDHLAGGKAPAAPSTPPRRSTRDLSSTHLDEGRVVGGGSEAVAGADPPGRGAVMRPAGVAGEPVPPGWTAGGPSGNTYTVAAGDTLWGISTKVYGDSRHVAAIQAANPGVDPKALRAGMRLVMPARETVAKPAAGADPTAGLPPTKVYVVQKNDTLIGIASRLYSDASMYKKIFDANQDILPSPNSTLQIGMRLRLPDR